MLADPQRIVTYPFGTAHLHRDFLIMVMNEGITVVPEYNTELMKLANGFYQGRPFVYITHRKHSYSVDPAIYRETSEIPNLVGFAVVARKEIKRSTTTVEKLFLKKPFMAFEQLEDAIVWARLIVKG